jgi:dTMP kinase
MPKGLVIGFEGIEKSGKETQSKLLKEYLTKEGILFESGREPGGTAYGEAERRCLQDPHWIERVNQAYADVPNAPKLNANEEFCPAAEMFGYLKSRAQFFNLKVKPVFDAGGIYILDRSGDSTTAYQGFGLYRGDPKIVDLISRNNVFAMQGVSITRTWLIDITVDEMLRRSDHNEFAAGKDRIEQRDPAYFERVRQGYLWIAKQEPIRVMAIDGAQPVEVIHAIVKKNFLNLLKNCKTQDK